MYRSGKVQGIPQSEIGDAFEDLAAFIAGEIAKPLAAQGQLTSFTPTYGLVVMTSTSRRV